MDNKDREPGREIPARQPSPDEMDGDQFVSSDFTYGGELAHSNNAIGNIHIGIIIGDVAMYVATAVASGVLGNAAYDRIRTGLGEFRKTGSVYRDSDNRFLHQRKERELIAKLAVQARLAELDLPVPRFEALQVTSINAESSGHDLEVTGNGVTGIVHIPGGEPDGSRVLVDIRAVASERPDLP